MLAARIVDSSSTNAVNFSSAHNKALTVALCGRNPNSSPVTIHSCNTAPTPIGPAEIVGDDCPAIRVADGRSARLGLDFRGNI